MHDDLSLRKPATRLRSTEEGNAAVIAPVAISLRRSSTAITARRYPKFINDRGVPEIRLGAREFECIGASPPHDHPHVYIDMAEQAAILCPYCATRFRFDPRLGAFEAEPSDSLFLDNSMR